MTSTDFAAFDNFLTAMTVSCPTCKASAGGPCDTRLARGYHLTRADKAVRGENRKRYGHDRPRLR